MVAETPNNNNNQTLSNDSSSESSIHVTFEEGTHQAIEASRDALHRFFYPTTTHREQQFDQQFQEQADEDQKFIEHFWTTYDDIVILAIMTQVGIVFRLASATWFRYFDDVFRNDSALFVNLPLNCLSCFLMGLLCSGDRLMEIVVTRFSPPRLQIDLQRQRQQDEEQQQQQEQILSDNNLRRRRHRLKQDKFFRAWIPPTHLDDDLRDVQLLALERRIRASKCLLLFPVKKEDIDVMEHYFQEGYKKNEEQSESEGQEVGFDLALEEGLDGDDEEEERHRPSNGLAENGPTTRSLAAHLPQQVPPTSPTIESQGSEQEMDDVELQSSEAPAAETPAVPPQDMDINQMIGDIVANVDENLLTLQRVNLAEGWDKGTTAESMSEDLLLGLRDGFCGALSSFSSWNSAMINLMRDGAVGTAFVGYMLGLQLPIVAYRFGQHVALYIFIWRCRRETKRDERRGYGIRLAMNEESERDQDDSEVEMPETPKFKIREALPSVRAIATAALILAIVTQVTMLSFFSDPQNEELALSLLFSPLGVWARWRLSKYNNWRPSFPLGTFLSNMSACALSGGFGTLIAGNPSDQERIFLQSFINGFGGTLSSLATFIVEILAGTDPILLRFDGIWYAVISIGSAMVIGFIFSASVDWADQVE